MKLVQKWDLDSLLPHPETDSFRERFDALRTELASVADRSNELPAVGADSAAVKAWGEFLDAYASVRALATEFHAFIDCHAAADAGNAAFLQKEAALAALIPLHEQIAANVELGLQAASDSEFEAFCGAAPELQAVEFFLRDSRRMSQLRLPRELEQLANDLSVDGIHAWGRLYDRVSGRLRIRLMERGEIVEKSPGQVRFDSADRAVRENEFYAWKKAWSSIADVCAEAVNHIAGTRLTLYRRLGLTDHLEAPLRYNRMRRETLEAMFEAISSRKEMLAAYLERKAQLLGIERPAWFDLEAPLTRTTSDIGYDEGCRVVVETFRGFSDDLADFADRAVRERWIEAENREGKRQGGFCTDFPVSRQSRIFMTYRDTADSLSTLAHELGHAYHSYVLRDEPYLLQAYPMNLAETASTFAETIVAEERLRQAAGDEAVALLDGMLSDASAFLMNIPTRFLFEDRFHHERREGELSAERLSVLMVEAQKEAYAGVLADDGYDETFWMSKLHFYISTLPFYNFPYTFGYLLSLGVYSLGCEESSGFADRYCEFLKQSGCADAEDAVTRAFGIDLTDSAFWNRSLDVVAGRVDRFLELTAE